MAGLTSPVNGPQSPTAHFWAPSARGPESQAEVTNGVDGLDMIEVHLPVSADQRTPPGAGVRHRGGSSRRAPCPATGALTAPLSAERPGRSPYSSSSSEAPPPVEMKLTRSVRSSSSTAAALSPPPTTV